MGEISPYRRREGIPAGVVELGSDMLAEVMATRHRLDSEGFEVLQVQLVNIFVRLCCEVHISLDT